MEPKESKSSLHFVISLIKSGVRIGACGVLIAAGVAGVSVEFAVTMAGALLLVAELFGIIEEL